MDGYSKITRTILTMALLQILALVGSSSLCAARTSLEDLQAQIDSLSTELEALSETVNALPPEKHMVSSLLSVSENVEYCTQTDQTTIDCAPRTFITVGLGLNSPITLEGDVEGTKVRLTISKYPVSPDSWWVSDTPEDFEVAVTMTSDDWEYTFILSPASPVYSSSSDGTYTHLAEIRAKFISDSVLELVYDITGISQIETDSLGIIAQVNVEDIYGMYTDGIMQVNIANVGDGEIACNYIVSVEECNGGIQMVPSQSVNLEFVKTADLEFILHTNSIYGWVGTDMDCKVYLRSSSGNLYDRQQVFFRAGL